MCALRTGTKALAGAGVADGPAWNAGRGWGGWLERAQAHVRALQRLARPAWAQTPAQRHPVRMKGRTSLVLVDLPVDFAVVLEQQERAGQAKRTERALRKR